MLLFETLEVCGIRFFSDKDQLLTKLSCTKIFTNENADGFTSHFNSLKAICYTVPFTQDTWILKS